jgi:hypothetical protein
VDPAAGRRAEVVTRGELVTVILAIALVAWGFRLLVDVLELLVVGAS